VRNPALGGLGSALLRTSRPVLFFTLWLNRALGGGQAWGFHLVNLLIHAGAALALYGVVRRALRLARPAPGWAERADGVALACAALWGVHPLTTGAVTYIWQRAESLMGLFYLLTLYAALRGWTDWQARWTVLAVVFGALGMASKEVMVTAPLMAAAFDWCLTSRRPRELLRQRWRLYAGLASTWCVLGGVMAMRRAFAPVKFYAWGGTSWGDYLATQAAVIAHYITLTFWPRGLCFDYNWPVADGFGAVWPQAAALTALAALAAAGVARRRAWALPLVWFFAILAPTSSVVPRPDPAFEHRMYLPLAGLLAAVVLGVTHLAARRERWRRARAAAIVAVAVLAVATARRNRVYGSEVTMWADVVAKAPHNLRAWNDLAVALSEEGAAEAAQRCYGEVLERVRPDTEAWLARPAEERGGALVKDSAPYHFYRAHVNLGLLLETQLSDPAAAAEQYRRALRVRPGDATVRAMLERARGAAEAATKGGKDGSG